MLSICISISGVYKCQDMETMKSTLTHRLGSRSLNFVNKCVLAVFTESLLVCGERDVVEFAQ